MKTEKRYDFPFQQELNEYLQEYKAVLSQKFTHSTVSKHYCVIRDFIDYAVGYYPVRGFDDLTTGMAGSKFTQYYNNHSGDALQTVTVKNILREFFQFIKDEHGIYNQRFLDKLKK